MRRYGFNLGEIQGLTYDIPVINVSIKRGEVSNNYTFTFNDEVGAWVSENVGMVYDADGSFYLSADFNESDVGDVYNVTLSTSVVEENFKSAVETVLADNGLNLAATGTYTLKATINNGLTSFQWVKDT